jgi:hypothetical protein
MTTDEEIKLNIVTKLVREKVTGNKKMTVTTATRAVAIHDRGDAKELIDDMLSDPASPIEGYGGGGRKNIRLTSLQAGVEFIKDHGGDVPFGVDI